MRVIDFKRSHIALAKIKGHDLDEFLMDNILDSIEQNKSGTFIKDGKIVCFAGIVKEGEKIGHVWMIPTEHFHKSSIEIAKMMKEYTSSIPKKMGLTLLKTKCHKDSTVKRWLEWLGFRPSKELYTKGL